MLVVKNTPANEGDVRNTGLTPGSGRSPGGGHGNPLQFLRGESHGQRSLAGYSSRGHRVGHDWALVYTCVLVGSAWQAFSNAVLWAFGPDASFCWRLHVDRGTTATSLVCTHWMPRSASPLGCGDPIHLQTLSHIPWGSKSPPVGTLYPHPSPCPPHIIL